MKIINYQNVNHTIKLVPRFVPTDVLSVHLYNESLNDTTIVNCTYTYLDGYLFVSFDFDFLDDDRFSFKIMENNSVVYRGKIFSTIEDTQNYKQTTDLYEY